LIREDFFSALSALASGKGESSCGWPRSAFALSGPCFIREIREIRGTPLFGCGWPHWPFPRQKQSHQIISKKTVDKN
jgi:hypothetical protein